VCSTYDSTPSSLTFTDVMESILKFSRENVEQFLVLNFKSENVKQPVNTKDLEEIIDERCQIHTELTAGTNEYVKKEVHIHKYICIYIIIIIIYYSALLFKYLYLERVVGHLWVKL